MVGLLGALRKLSPRQQRAQDQGFDLSSPYFHASKQDIDEMKPGYNDGLVFVTPDAEFANNWLGKGKFQERQGGTGSIEELKKQKQILRAEHNKVMNPLSEADRERYYNEVAWPQTRQIIQEIDQADQAIYPLLSKTKKPFRPDQDYKVFDELYDKQRLDSGFSPADGLPTFRDALKDGSYLLYENNEVVDFLKSKGYDSMFLKESSGSGEKFSTLAVFDGKDLRSTNAQFDPSKTESRNILASGAPVAAGLLGATALIPEEAAAGPTLADQGAGIMDFLANAAQGAVAPIANAPNTIIEALTSDRSNEQLKADRDQRLAQNDYQLRTDLGQQYTQNAQETMGGLLQSLAEQAEQSRILEAVRNSRILQTIPNAYNQLPERGRIVGNALLDSFL